MNANQLRTLAIATMLIDHVGAVFFEDLVILRIIGRLAFPIFAFLIANGYAHTRNINKYMIRMGLFALISEVPFDLAFFGKVGFEHQNVFFTLFLALVALRLYDEIMKEENGGKTIFGLMAVMGVAIGASLLKTDYGLFGILMVFFFHLHKEEPFKAVLKVSVINLYMGIAPLIYVVVSPDVTFQMMYIVQTFAVVGVLFTLLYNKQKGRGIQLLNYAFYPVHLPLLLLWLIPSKPWYELAIDIGTYIRYIFK